MARTKTKIDLGNIQRTICSDILDTADVIKSQIMNEVVAGYSKKLEQLDLVNIKKTVDHQVSMQVNQLIDRVVQKIS